MQVSVILIDVMNCVFRNHYAHHGLSSNGRPTGMIYGFLKTIADLRENVSKKIILAWDHGVPVPGAAKPRNWREGICPAYKATRNHDHDDEYKKVLAQLPLLHDVVTNMLGYSSVSVMGLEADDVIGILTNVYQEEIFIFSTDKDMYQLLNEARIHVLVPKKEGGKFRRIFQSDVERASGIPTSQWASYLALGGDGSDNIKPMRGMGPKTAIKLVQAGALLHLSWAGQDEQFKLHFSKYAPAWEEIQKSYHAAKIPRRWDDSRIRDCVTVVPPKANPEQSWPSEAAKKLAQERFLKLCANLEFTSLLSIRRKFFEGEPSACPSLTATPQRNAVAIPPLPTKQPRRTLI